MVKTSGAEGASERVPDAPTMNGHREAIIAAASRLFAERGHRAVSVRDVADEAGVTHPLIYYYWASKDDLLAAVLEGSQQRMRRLPPEVTPAQAAALLAREALERNREYLLTLARALLDGTPSAEWPGGFPAVERLVALATAAAEPGDALEARTRVAAAVAQLFGWALVEDALLEMTGITADDRDRAREVLLACISDTVGPATGARDTPVGGGLG
jgi:AcrR family transcriptional regulator